MADRSFNYDMIFRAQTAQAKGDVNKMREAVSVLNAETNKTSGHSKKNGTSLTAEAKAARDAAASLLKLSAAERQAREEMAKRAGVPAPKMPLPDAPKTPKPQPPLSPQEKDDIRARFDPMFVAQRAYKTEIDEIKKAEKAAVLTSDQVAAAQARVQGRYDHSVEAIKRTDAALQGGTRTMKLQRHEARVLSYQITDTWQSFMLGMPPMQILMQQGPQVIDVFGGIGNTLRHMRQFITPARLGLGLLATTAIVGVTSWNAYLKSTKEVETAHAGLGRGLATSSAQLEMAARAGANAAGISIKAARTMEVQFLRTGKIGAEHYDDLIGLSKDFAATLGLESDVAGAQLADMFSDPAKAAETLYQKYGLIDAATMRYVQTLAAQNRQSEAQGALLDKLPKQLAKAADALTGLQRVKQGVGAFVSDLGDGIGEAIDGTIELYLGRGGPKSASELLGREFPRSSHPVITQDENSWFKFRQERGAKDRALYNSLRGAAGFEALQNSYYGSQNEDRKRQGKASLSLADGSGATALMRQKETLQNQIAALQAGVGAPGQDAFQQDKIQEALEAKTRVLDALVTRQTRLNDLDRLDAQIAAERNPILRAELEARRARLSMMEQEVSQTEIDIAANRARQKVVEQTIASGQAQAEDLRTETEIRNRLSAQVAAGVLKSEDMNRLLQEELTLRPLVAAAAVAEGAEKQRLIEVIEQMRQAYKDQAAADKTADRTLKLKEYLKTQHESLAKLRMEQVLLGQSEDIRARTLASFEVEKKIRELGLSGQQADQIRTEAAHMLELRQEIDRVSDAWERVGGAAEAAIDGSIDALMSGDISGAFESLQSEITSLFTDLAIKNPLKNAILGTDLSTMNDVGGLQGIWDQLTGKVAVIDPTETAAKAAAQSVGSMQISAMNVTISSKGNISTLGAMGGAANSTGTSFAGGTLSLSQQDIVDLKKTVATEWVQGAGDTQAQGIIDTVLNRVASGKWGNSVSDVVNAKSQFSDINGPVAWKSGRNNVSDLPMSIIDERTNAIVEGWLKQRADGAQSVIGDNLNYANANYSDASNLSWINKLAGPVLGSGDAVHQHGTTVDLQGFRPGAFGVQLPDTMRETQTAFGKFQQTILSTDGDLGGLGKGFGAFGQALAGLGKGGGSGDILSSLLGIGMSALGLPGFEVGGATGGSNPKKVAGVVHQKEFVFDAAATSRIGVGNLEAIRRGRMPGYEVGGYVGSARAHPFLSNGNASAANGGGNTTNIQLINNSSVPLQMETEETTDARGQKTRKMVLSDSLAEGISARGGKGGKALQSQYNLKRNGNRRSV